MPDWIKKRALITVRIYPTPSAKSVEASCTAGVTEKGEWLRLFPIPYRLMAEQRQFKKWHWIEAEAIKATNDLRPESFKVNQDSIVVGAYRAGENPARWRGHLNHLLAARSKVRAVKHHAALPYTEISAFMKELGEIDGTGAAALEFLILTAARTSEVIYARWTEVDLKNHVWIVPAERMKGGCEHRVPLSTAATTVLKRTKQLNGEYVFPGRTPDSPLSNMALLMTLGRMNHGNITSHGFRSTFRDWAAERTNVPG